MSHELEEFDLPRVWKQRVAELEEEGGFDQILISNWPGKGEKREREREGQRERILARVYEIFGASYFAQTCQTKLPRFCPEVAFTTGDC